MKVIKYALIGLATLLVLTLAGIAVFVLTFDPNRYKGEIEQAVKERTGRTLKLQGDLKVAIFPSLGADVANVSLTEHASDRQFLTLDSAHASVALLPLLRGAVVVDEIKVSGLSANVVKNKNGKFNFDDLLQSKQGEAGSTAGATSDKVRFDIAGVAIERSAISYKDLAGGKELALSDVTLSTGRIAERADGKLEFAASAKGSNPALDLKSQLSGTYDVDLRAKTFSFSKIDGSVKGTLDKDALEAKISAPSIEITSDKAAGEAVTAELKLKGPQRAIEAFVKLSGVKGSAKALEIPALTGELAMSGSDMPKTFKVPVSGSMRADLEKETANAELTSKFDESNVQAKLGVVKFSPAAYVFDINVDKLNLDQYFPPKSKPATAKQEDTPIDLSTANDLTASGKLRFGALQVKGLKLSNVIAEVKAANGRVDVSPHSGSLYGGTVSGALTLQANGNRVALKESLANVSIGPFLRDAAQQDRLEGRGSVTLDVSGAGASVNALKRSLAGSAKVNLRDGAIKGINIGELMNKVKSLGKSEQGSADTGERTDFTELSATFTIKNGVAHNQDLSVKSPLLRLGGAGDIDVGNSTLNYVLKASVAASVKGLGGARLDQLAGLTIPVKLSGPFDAMQYQIDYGAAVGELAKSKIGGIVGERIEKNKTNIPDQVRDQLKGLLGR